MLEKFDLIPEWGKRYTIPALYLGLYIFLITIIIFFLNNYKFNELTIFYMGNENVILPFIRVKIFVHLGAV